MRKMWKSGLILFQIFINKFHMFSSPYNLRKKFNSSIYYSLILYMDMQ